MPEKRTENILKSDAADEGVENDTRRIFCRKCGNTITFAEKRITAGGSHEHTFFNPQGIAFQIGCFSSAPGCVSHGRPTQEFSWFKGYAWSLALCVHCATHLGWRYQAGESGRFWGLILDRIAESL